ncbi:protein SRC2-like [Phragmites australis]|uniref:protein SRC2-like n=1 Tax=Phragmites australis TaxID=29695 RepID=UPI002D77B32E|nr:protein SRC2-like [Phragmites australis]
MATTSAAPAMAYRVLELTLVSANDLKKALFSRMRVYAVASISGGGPRMPTHGTHADRSGGCNPAWNAVLHFPIPAAADTRGLALHVLLRSERLFGNRDVGEVFVPIDDLLASADKAGDPRPVSYQVRRPHSGRAHGTLYFCYKFIDVPAAGVTETKQGQYVKYVQDSEKGMDYVIAPAIAYPPRQATPAYQPAPYGSPYAGYPPQPYAYAGLSPYGYNAAAPQPAMYGYAPPPVAAPARQGGGGVGVGLGLGLLGGAVGGMMLGEMVGDFEGDAAYDAGFNDALAF